MKNLENKELKLRFHGLGADSVRAISFPLEVNVVYINYLIPSHYRSLLLILSQNIKLNGELTYILVSIY